MGREKMSEDASQMSGTPAGDFGTASNCVPKIVLFEV